MRNESNKKKFYAAALCGAMAVWSSGSAMGAATNYVGPAGAGGSGTWDAVGNWDSGVPTSSTDAVFNASGINATETITLANGDAALGIIVNNTGGTTVANASPKGSQSSLALGADGITIGSGITSQSKILPQNLILEANQTWNAASSYLVGGAGLADATVITPIMLTFSGTQGPDLQASITDNSKTGTVAIIANTGYTADGGNNTYSGGTTINGTSVTDKSNSPNLAFGTGPIYLGSTSGSASSAIYDGGGTESVANDITVGAGSTGSSTIGVYGSYRTFSFSGGITLNHTLTITPVQSKNNSNDTVTLSGVISGTSGITTTSGSGAGTTNISNTNTYNGATTVTGGTFNLTGSIADSATTVTGTSTIEGTGTFGALTFTSGNGILSPATTGTIGTLSASSVALASTTTFNFDLNSSTTASDLLNDTGALSLANPTLAATDDSAGTGTFGTVYDVANYSSLTGTFNGLADGGAITIGSNDYEINYGTAVTDEITLTQTSGETTAPEPSSAVLLAISSLTLLCRRRHQQCPLG